MPDEDSEDERMRALMESWVREDSDNLHDSKSKKRVKKKKKKKDKGTDSEDDDYAIEKKERKKSKEKRKSLSKEKRKSISIDSDASKSPRRDKRKSKSADEMKSPKKDKKKKEKKKDKEEVGLELEPEPETLQPPPNLVLDPVDYVENTDAVSETSQDKKMKELLQQWDEDGDESSDESESSEEDYDEEETSALNIRRMTKAELQLEDNALDHIILASPDFAEALKEFESMTGIKPSVGGSLKGLGTKAARVGLDNQAYIEILGPDPKNPGPIGNQLMELEEGSLVPYHYAIRETDFSELADVYIPMELGYDPDRIAMTRAGPDGTPRRWEMLFMHGHFHGGAAPYFVDWGDCEHPIGSIPQVGSLKSFVVTCPGGSKVQDLLRRINGLQIEDGDMRLEFSFGSPEGTITFSADLPKGLKFPGYKPKHNEDPQPAKRTTVQKEDSGGANEKEEATAEMRRKEYSDSDESSDDGVPVQLMKPVQSIEDDSSDDEMVRMQ